MGPWGRGFTLYLIFLKHAELTLIGVVKFSRMIDRIESWRQMSLLAMSSSSSTTPDEDILIHKGTYTT